MNMSTERCIKFLQYLRTENSKKSLCVLFSFEWIIEITRDKYGTVRFKQSCHHLHPTVNEGISEYPQILRYDMYDIYYCNWVTTKWQWSNIGKRQHKVRNNTKTTQKHKKHKRDNKNTKQRKNIKEYYKTQVESLENNKQKQTIMRKRTEGKPHAAT